MGHLSSILITFRLFEKRTQQLTQSLPIIFYTIFHAKGIATVKRGKKHHSFFGTANSDRAKTKG